MKVLELLDEILEICDTSMGVPLSSNIIVKKDELEVIVREIADALPKDITQAKYITDERERILEGAREEYGILLKDAVKQADRLTNEHEISRRAREVALKIEEETNAKMKKLKLDTYAYVDEILADFQDRMSDLNKQYLGIMFDGIQKTFTEIDDKLSDNRSEITDLAFKERDNNY